MKKNAFLLSFLSSLNDCIVCIQSCFPWMCRFISLHLSVALYSLFWILGWVNLVRCIISWTGWRVHSDTVPVSSFYHLVFMHRGSSPKSIVFPTFNRSSLYLLNATKDNLFYCKQIFDYIPINVISVFQLEKKVSSLQSLPFVTIILITYIHRHYKLFHLSRMIIHRSIIYAWSVQRDKLWKNLSTIFRNERGKWGKKIHTNENDLKSLAHYIVAYVERIAIQQPKQQQQQRIQL